MFGDSSVATEKRDIQQYYQQYIVTLGDHSPAAGLGEWISLTWI